jgi:uncharacterized protein with FMN-binding domain
MPTQNTRQQSKFTRNARNVGISAIVAATIGGYALYQRSSVSASPFQLSPISIAAEATLEATPELSTGIYHDGEYQGDSVRAGRWGNVQVTAIIENGNITDFKINDYPHSRSMSQRINQVALPYLMQETITAQSTTVDMISGATLTSEAFIQSLQSALDDASTAAMATATPTLSTSGSSI